MKRGAMNGRILFAVGLAAFVLVHASAPVQALTSKQKMETCRFGADHQQLKGTARKKFMANCMANRDSPRGKPAPKTQ